jgi:probable F420-dependent oxidoreductase
MKFTFTYPIITHPSDPELVSPVGIATIAKAAETAGFHGMGFTDHPAPTQRWLDAGGHDSLDPFVAMGFAAAHTETLRFIPNVVVLPYRNPFVVAKAGATLDVLSGGRFTLAVGVGYLKGEFAALGVEFDERTALVEESLDAVRAVWTGDDVSFEGKHFLASGITAHPRPISSPHPPIWIGGNTGRARQRVATRGDGWVPFAAPAGLAATARTAEMNSIEALAAGIDDLKRRCDNVNRDWSTIDVSFKSLSGGNVGEDDFDAGSYLDGLQRLKDIGVTWTQVIVGGDSVDHIVEAIAKFGETVIQQFEA